MRQPATLPAPPAAVEPACEDGPLAIEVRTGLDLPRADAAAVESIRQACPHVGVFASPAWLAGRFADPPAGCEPALVLVRGQGVVRGLAPIATHRTPSHLRVGLLGGGSGSDRIDLIAAPGFETAAADAFVSWLTESCGRRSLVVELRDLPSDSPLVGAFARAGVRQPLVVQPRELHVLPYLDLRAQPAAALAGAGAGSLRKHRRWLERRGETRVELVDSAAAALDAFEWLRHFLHLRWRDLPGGSALDDPRALRFHRRVIPLLLAERRLRMLRLSAGPRTIGVFYGFATARWWGYYLAGYDRQWAGRLHLGRLLLAAALDAAAAEGAWEFDFLKGAEPVKYFWPVRERTTTDLDVYSSGPGAQLHRAARAGRDAAAALVKAGRGLF